MGWRHERWWGVWAFSHWHWQWQRAGRCRVCWSILEWKCVHRSPLVPVFHLLLSCMVSVTLPPLPSPASGVQAKGRDQTGFSGIWACHTLQRDKMQGLYSVSEDFADHPSIVEASCLGFLHLNSTVSLVEGHPWGFMDHPPPLKPTTASQSFKIRKNSEEINLRDKFTSF